MSNTSPPVTEDELHAYVDGQLSPERCAELEVYLTEDSAAAKRVASYQQQTQMLRTLFGPVEQEEVPKRLIQAAKPPPHRFVWRYAIVAVWTFIAAFGGWVIRGTAVETPTVTYRIIDHATIAHAVYSPEVRHPVEVTADHKEHLVKWLSRRMGQQIRAPELSELGYELVGGRLLPGDNGPASQFMYQDVRGNRLTFYAMANNQANPRETAFRYAENDEIKILYWMNGPLGYAIAGEADKTQLINMAHIIYQQLNH